MSGKIKEVSGTLVTNTEVEPPFDWTNEYEEMGGDKTWGEYGDVAILMRQYGLEGDVQPLFSTKPFTGEALSLFEIEHEFYIYNVMEASLYKIYNTTDLRSIVSIIGDPNKGLSRLDIERL